MEGIGLNGAADKTFTVLFHQHKNHVYEVAIVLPGDCDAADIVQEAFLRMCTQLSAGNDIIKPKNWLLLVSVRILCLNRIRDSRKHATVESLSPLPDKINTSGVSLMMLESAVQALDPDLCEARILRELWGLSYAEIAEILDATVTSQKL